MVKRIAYTIAELVVVISIVAFLGVISIYSYSKITERGEVLTIKTAYDMVKKGLKDVVENPTYYADGSDLSDTGEVTYVDDETASGTSKFRKLLLYEMSVSLGDSVSCLIYTGDGAHQTTQNCYMSENGIVFGIPDTDFSNLNMVSHVSNANQSTYKSLYITVYPHYNKIHQRKGDYLLEEAMILGVNPDGGLEIIDTDCDKKDSNGSFVNAGNMYCRASSYLTE